MEDVAVDLFFQVGLADARQQLVLRIGARGIADHTLVFGELLVEHERIVPLKIHRGRLILGLRARAHENSFRITFILYQVKALWAEAQLNWTVFGSVVPGRRIALPPEISNKSSIEIPRCAIAHLRCGSSSHPATTDALDFKLFVGDDLDAET